MLELALENERDILKLIQSDAWRMDILRLVRSLKLPDWWIGAGFVRNMVWDYLHEYKKSTSLNDIDIIYFNPADEPIEAEKKYWQKLKNDRPEVIWSVTNTAHRHLKTGQLPYNNATDALSRWVETATCIGVTMENDDSLHLTAPCGIEDLLNLTVCLNPLCPEGRDVYSARQAKKQWQKIWPKLILGA